MCRLTSVTVPARQFSKPARPDKRLVAIDFVVEIGYPPKVATGVVDALLEPGTGVSKGTLMPTIKALAGRWEVDEDGGLKKLADAVVIEQARTEGREVVQFWVQPAVGARFQCEGWDGMTLKEVVELGDGPGAALLAEQVECACDGLMACSTCQVVIDPEWFERVGAATEEEEDMLELAFEPKPTSRLGCMVTLRPELSGCVIHIPGGANNLFDFIPFE
jgi:ferredoxin